MIIPKRDAKSYGAVHIDYFLTFIGFCKKVSSDEVQSIDVFIDGNKIDTIVCDKTIDKVSQIYDIEGHGFEYDLPEVYFDKRHLLSFRCSDSGEELVNSPISTICKNDEKFNEYMFLNSLSKPIDEEKIKEVYGSNSIGFLATEENLKDKNFVEYIKELMIKLPDVEFKGFCFNDVQKSTLLKINLIRCKPHTIQNIEDIRRAVEIFIWNYKTNDTISNKIVLNIRNGTILSTIFLEGIKNLRIKDWEAKPENIIISRIINNLEYFGFTEEESDKAHNSVLVMLNNRAKNYVSQNIWEEVTPESNFYYFLNILIVNYWLNSSAFKHYYYETIHIKNERLV
jgi:hypothetical protein